MFEVHCVRLSAWNDFDTLNAFSQGLVGLTWQIDGGVLLHRQDAEFQFGGALRQSPETVEEWSAILEVVCHEFAASI